MTDKTDLIREIHEYVTTHGGENTATHLLVQAASAIQTQAAELEAVGAGGVQALSAGPAGWKWVPVEPTADQEWAGKNAALRCSTMGEACKIYKAMLAASPTPPAEQQATSDPLDWPLPCDITAGGVTIGKGCPLRTVQTRLEVQAEANALLMRHLSREQAAPKAAPESFLDGADVQDESGVLAYYSREAVLACITAALESVAAPKAAPGEPTQEMIASVMSLVDLETSDPEDHRYDDGSKLAAQICRAVLALAPQQEAQEPVAWYEYNADLDAWFLAYRRNPKAKTRPLVFGDTAPLPAPAPLSDEAVRDAAFEAVRKKLCALPRYSFVLDDDGLVRRAPDRTGNWIEFDEAHALFDPVAVDAALAAQGGTP